MMQQLFKKQRNDAEAGIYLPIMAIGIVVLLSVAALSLDTANMFYTKLQYKKASDTAVIGALEYRVERGISRDRYDDTHLANFNATNYTYTEPAGENGSFEYISQAVANRAREIARNNILFNLKGQLGSGGLTEDKVLVHFKGPTDSNDNSEILEVTIDKPQDFLLMSSIPLELLGLARSLEQFQVSNVSTGNIKQANIVIMLDLSSSMICPDNLPLFSNGASYDASAVPLADFLSYEDGSTSPVNVKQKCLDASDKRNKVEQAYGGIPDEGSVDNVDVDLDGDGINETYVAGQIITEAYDEIENYCYCGCLATPRSCPSTFTLTDTASGTQSVFDNKLNGLIVGIDNFLERFRVGKDNISIIGFNSNSHIWTPLAALTQEDVNYWDVSSRGAATNATPYPPRTIDESKRSSVFSDIALGTNGLKLGHWTNTADALLTAFKHNLDFNRINGGSSTSLTPRHETHYVLFTDGAPTATRLLTDIAALANTTSGIGSDLNDSQLRGDLIMLASTSPRISAIKQNSSVNAGGTYSVTRNSAETLWAPLPLMTTPLTTMGNGNGANKAVNATTAYAAKNYRIIDNSDSSVFDNQLHALRLEEVLANNGPTLLASLAQTGVDAAALDPDRPQTYTNFMPTSWDFNTPLSLRSDVAITSSTFPEKIQYQMTNTSNTSQLACNISLDVNNNPSPPWLMVAADNTPGEEWSFAEDATAGACFLGDVINFDYSEIFYSQAIHYSDMIRRYKGIVHTIGYGPIDSNLNNVFQSKGDAFARKDLLLARIAGDLGKMSLDPLDYVHENGDIISSQVTKNNGTYEAALSSQELTEAFSKIADLIVRLTQ